MRSDEHTHRREAYGVRGSSTHRGDSLCEGSMSRREGTGMASDRVITTGAAMPASAYGAAAGAPIRDAPQASHNQFLTRAALYARVSTEKQEREETVASQVDQLYQTAVARGYDMAPGSVFIDDGVS